MDLKYYYLFGLYLYYGSFIKPTNDFYVDVGV